MQITTQKYVRFAYRNDKSIYKIIKINDLINECTILNINEIDESKTMTVSQTELENVELYEIRNSAEETAWLDTYLTEKEANIIKYVSDNLKGGTYSPTLEINKKNGKV